MCKQTKQKGIYPMSSIAQILNFKKDIELISLNMFKIQSELNVLQLLNSIPTKIISTLSNPEPAKASEYINKLHNLLNPVNRAIHKVLYEQKQLSKTKDEPYAL